MANLSVLTLTYNERLHIERCITSARQFAQQVFVVDCGSDDGTVEIARSLGAHVVEHAWENHHGRQVNWALDNLPIATDWVFRLDADEWVTPELAQELNERLAALPQDVSGVVLRRRLYAFGKQLRWGGQDHINLLRVWRTGQARCEERWMDEHMQLLSGHSVMFEHDFADENRRPLSWWIEKHSRYAVREVADTLIAKRQEPAPSRRSASRGLYSNVPRFVRPGLYFSYRYFLKLGFLDGAAGLQWHVLQGFWYRFLIDAILTDVERRAAAEGVEPLAVLEETYGLKLR